MQPRRHGILSCIPLLLVAACTGGGSSADSQTAPVPGTVQLLLDPATGSDSFVEVEVAAAALQRPDGSLTANLLPAPVLLTLADPTGDLQGLRLPGTPAGSYRGLHLMLAPGSGHAVFADGSRAPVDFASPDLAVPFDVDLVTDGLGSAWVRARHTAAVALHGGANHRVAWAPQLRADSAVGLQLQDARMHVLRVHGNRVFGGLNGTDPAAVELQFDANAILLDANGVSVSDPATYLESVAPGSDISVTGVCDGHGSVRSQSVRQCNAGPRLIGRITDLDPLAGTFGMDVQAEAGPGHRALLGTPDHVVVHVGMAPIHFSHTWRSLTFAELMVGDLAKVRVAGRTGSDVAASEIEISSHQGAPACQETEGLVDEVRLAENLIVLVPRGNDPLLVGGLSVARAEVTVTASTIIERFAPGAPHTPIQLGDLVAGQDRVWVRGTATGPASLAASYLRVRTN